METKTRTPKTRTRKHYFPGFDRAKCSWCWPGDLRAHCMGERHHLTKEQVDAMSDDELEQYHDKWHNEHKDEDATEREALMLRWLDMLMGASKE